MSKPNNEEWIKEFEKFRLWFCGDESFNKAKTFISNLITKTKQQVAKDILEDAPEEYKGAFCDESKVATGYNMALKNYKNKIKSNYLDQRKLNAEDFINEGDDGTYGLSK